MSDQTTEDVLLEAFQVMRASRRAQPITFVVLAACFVPLVGWLLAGAWLAAVLTLTWPVGRILAANYMRLPPRVRTVCIMLYLAATSAAVATIGAAMALRNGVWGLIVAEVFAFGIALIVMGRARRSALAFFATMTPVAGLLLFLATCSFSLAPTPAAPTILLIATVLLLLHTHKAAADHRRQAIALVEARARAETSTAAKSAFVALVSHELRTPISGILAGAEELRKAASEPSSRNNANLVLQAGRMMRTLLNDLLDLSKIEVGRMDVETISFDLRETLLETAQFWRPELRRRQLSLRLEGMRALPRWVMGDPTRLRQVLNNLFSNAVKFTEHGGIVFSALITEPLAGCRELQLAVRDTGPGMTADQVDRLFTAFDQLSPSTARTHGGTGLGLHLSRSLSRLMGGDLRAESRLGDGSTFILTLPLRLAEAAPAAPAGPSRGSDAEGLRLLIVDDHQVNRQAFSLMLEPISERIVCAEDGEQALAALAVEDFDLVLMDIHMPGLDGRETTLRLRAAPGPNRTTPVIALTGSVSTRDVDSYLSAGMDAFVMKPVEARDLLAAISQVLCAEPAESAAARDRA